MLALGLEVLDSWVKANMWLAASCQIWLSNGDQMMLAVTFLEAAADMTGRSRRNSRRRS